jgi:hypothetical protein
LAPWIRCNVCFIWLIRSRSTMNDGDQQRRRRLLLGGFVTSPLSTLSRHGSKRCFLETGQKAATKVFAADALSS